MGMFDTLLFPEPIACVQCSTPIPSTQTKSLGSTLETYRVGDVVSADGITTGVLTEELYCEPCRKFDQKIYVTLWHGLITGFYTDEADAERNLLAVDRADILYYLTQHQRERRRVTGLLHRILSVMKSYADYAASEDKEAFLNKPFGFMVRSDLKGHLDAADPLKSIVEEYRRELGRAGEEVGLW